MQLTPEQEMLVASCRSLLERYRPRGGGHAAPESPGAAAAESSGAAAEQTAQAALLGELVDLGFTGLMVPEAQGGSGGTLTDWCLVAAEAGRSLAADPFFGATALALALASGRPEPGLQALAGEIAAGRTCSVALSDGGDWSETTVTAEPAAGGYRLDGVKRRVPWAAAGDLLCLVRLAGSPGDPQLCRVPAGAAGLSLQQVGALDPAQPLYTVQFQGVTLPEDSMLGPLGPGTAAGLQSLWHAELTLAAEMTGAAERALAMTVAYAQERVQFGQAIGQFQAVKHRCADMAVRTEYARLSWLEAAAAVTAGAADAGLAVSVAKAYCAEVCPWVAEAAVQMHGGIAFTWEYDLHLYLRRIRRLAATLGSRHWHLEQIARRELG